MNNLETLDMENVVLYKRATLDLSYKGITAIVGRNGSGKSLLANAISNILLNSTPVTEVKSRSKKDLFGDKTSVSLTGVFGKDRIQITKQTHGKSVRYQFRRNGKNLKVRTNGIAESKIAQLRVLSEEEFYSLVYIDSRRPSSFQQGSPATRMDFFTGIFRLSSFDSVRALLNSKLLAIKSDRNTITELKQQLRELGPAKSCEEEEAKLNTLRTEAKKLNTLYSDLHAQLTAAKIRESNRREYAYLVEHCGKASVSSTAKGSAIRSKLRARIAAMQDILEKAKEYADYLTDLQQYNRGQTKALAEIERLVVPKNPSEWLAEVEESRPKLERKMTRVKQEIQDTRDTISEFQDISKDTLERYRPWAKLDSKAATEEIKRLTRDVHQVEASLTKFEHHFSDQHTDANCPVCTTRLTKDNLRTVSKALTTRKKALDEKLTKLERDLDKHMKFITTRVGLREKERLTGHLEVQNRELSRVKTELEKLGRYKLEDVRLWVTLNKKLKAKPPAKVEKTDSVEAVQETIRDLRKLVEILDRLLPTLDSWNTKGRPIAKLEEEITRVNAKLKATNNRIPDLQSRVDLAKSAAIHRKKLRARLRGLEQKAEDIPVLERLVEAYSNKGLKMLLIRKIAALVERNLNLYASLLYANRFKFKLSVDVNKFDVLVSRVYKNRTYTSDIRTLSGAESRSFSFLLPLSLLPLIPADRRYNVLILDEPTTNMDPVMQQAFINDFLPKLTSIVPHVIVISPLAETYPKARVITVTNKDGESSLT